MGSIAMLLGSSGAAGLDVASTALRRDDINTLTTLMLEGGLPAYE
jgi:hypothetical protein